MKKNKLLLLLLLKRCCPHNFQTSCIADVSLRLQAQFIIDQVEQYDRCPEPVDFVFLGHVMYYVGDKYVPVVTNMLRNLSPNGCLVLSHLIPSEFHFKSGYYCITHKVFLHPLGQNIYFISSSTKIFATRLLSSRMHTARSLTVSPSMHCFGGCLLPGGVCSQGVPGPGRGSAPRRGI